VSDAKIVSAALRLTPPADPGLKITLTTQVPVLAGSVALTQPLVPKIKSAALVPEIVVVVVFTDDPVGFESVTACGELCVPTAWELNVNDPGAAFTLGFEPAPEMVMTIVLPAP